MSSLRLELVGAAPMSRGFGSTLTPGMCDAFVLLAVVGDRFEYRLPVQRRKLCPRPCHLQRACVIHIKCSTYVWLRCACACVCWCVLCPKVLSASASSTMRMRCLSQTAPPNLNNDVTHHGSSSPPIGKSWVEFTVELPGVTVRYSWLPFALPWKCWFVLTGPLLELHRSQFPWPWLLRSGQPSPPIFKPPCPTSDCSPPTTC